MQSNDDHAATISKYCTKNKFQHTSISLPQDAKIHFAGPPPEKGGKFYYISIVEDTTLPILDAYISFSLECASQVNASPSQYSNTPSHPLAATLHKSRKLSRD
jgi:hypothetical protein